MHQGQVRARPSAPHTQRCGALLKRPRTSAPPNPPPHPSKHSAALPTCQPLRTHRLRTYRRCFPGSAGVRWLVAQGHAGDEDAAAALGNAMLQAGLLHHVAYEHTFKNADLLYK